MKILKLTSKEIENFRLYLIEQEKSQNTIEKYIRDANCFLDYCDNRNVTKEIIIEYKKFLITSGYKARSINSMLASVNSILGFLGRPDLKVKALKVQREIFRSSDKELTREEYFRLCRTAELNGNARLSLILQTICATGIRVSELQFITVESAKIGEAVVTLKGKTRIIIIPNELKKKLLCYASKCGILHGLIFATKHGKSISRTNIWREMKLLALSADVNPDKVFPHNLRHLFARIFYNLEKDIAKLADILGHSSIETTRIYIIGTGIEHRKRIEMMRLII